GSSPSLSTGGGIEVGSGLIYGNINAAFTKAPGTNPADGALGTGVVFTGNQPGPTGGVIQANKTLGGIINLNPGPNAASTLTLTKGVQVFDAQGAGSSVIIDNGTFKTEALKPIALVTAPEQDEDALATLPLILKRTEPGASTVSVGNHGAELAMHRLANGNSVLVAAEDVGTVEGKQCAQIFAKPKAQFTHGDNGVIQLRQGEIFLNTSTPISVKTEMIEMRAAKGALVGIRSIDGCTYVRVCSGLGTVSVLIDGKSISLSSGEEMIVSNHKLDPSEIHPFDGLGRRNSHSTAFGNKHITISDFSIMSMIANHDSLLAMNKSNALADRHLMNRMLKTAATVDVVLKYRGAYARR
ncbi:MAG: hypothetical protein K2X81_01880, partial [Candidatus Obscuribacterales bacterium]|nr:hypothetical protein [Candidatus Obscuribacterales bacterium]